MTESKTQWSLDKRDLLYYFDKCRYLEEKVKQQEFEIERLKKQLKELQDVILSNSLQRSTDAT